MSNLLVLSAEDVESIISDFTPNDLQLLMARVFSQFHVFTAQQDSDADIHPENPMSLISIPHRVTFPMLNHTALFMPARIGSTTPTSSCSLPTPGNTAIKVVCVPHNSRSNHTRGLPATTMLLDENTGNVRAIVNARKLTALRNAAGSLLSTSLLATSQPESIVVFGAGQQTESHLVLFLRHFPSLKHCTIVNRTRNDRAISLHKKISDKFIGIVVELLAPKSHGEHEPEVKRVLESADLIVCATSATIPLFPSSYVRDGTHIILIGSYKPDMKEVGGDLISRSLKGTLLVDSKEGCLREAGELIDASVRPGDVKEVGEILPRDIHGYIDVQVLKRLSDVHEPRMTERSFDGPVTIFKSVGLGIQDVAIAEAVVQKAIDSNGRIGTIIPKYDSDL